MYFVLDRSGALHPCRWIDNYPREPKVRWITGQRFEEPIPEPIELTMRPFDPSLEEEDHGPEKPEYFKGKIPLFRDDLIQAMVEGGVDNLDLYRAVIVDPDTGQRFETYKAVNIIGAIKAADMENSDATVHPGGPVIDVQFDKLVLDQTKARGAMLFRLAESTTTILVHERLRDHLLSRGFSNLSFLKPSKVAIL